MRKVLLLIAVLLIILCRTASEVANDSRTPGVSQISATELREAEPVIQFLLDAATTDFHAHGPKPVRFRDVYFGYSSSGEKLYRICGQFQTSENENWVTFATIKTSGYEQWIGGQSIGFCQDPVAVWDKTHDLSSLLMRKLDAKTNQSK